MTMGLTPWRWLGARLEGLAGCAVHVAVTVLGIYFLGRGVGRIR